MAEPSAMPTDGPGAVPIAEPGGSGAPSRAMGRAGAVVASGTLVSRVLGFVNALLLYNTIGTIGQGADAFALANQLPNNVYAIIAGGTLTAVIVPAIVRATGHADGGERFLNKLVTLGVTLFTVVAIGVTIAAPLIVRLYAQSAISDGRGFGHDQMQLAIGFAYWCLPQVLFYALYAILSEVLNARGRFWGYAWAPVVNNLVFAAVLIAFQLAFGTVNGEPAASWSTGQIVLLAGGATLGIAAQSIALVIAWRRAGIRFRPDFRFRDSGLGRFGRLAAWMFATVLVMQASGIVESNVVSLATGSASIATLTVGWLIFMLPYSVITVSIMVPYLTRMSEHARDGELHRVGAALTTSVKTVLMLQTFASIGLAVLSPWLASFFASSAEGRLALAQVLCCYLVGLIPMSVSMLLQRALFALEDTRTVFFLMTGQVVLYVGALIAIAFAPTDLIAVLSAIALSGAMACTAIAASIVLARRVPGIRVREILGHWAWYAAAMVVAGAAGIGTTWLLRMGGIGAAWPVEGPWWQSVLQFVVVGIVMLVVYALVLWLTRNPELRGFLAGLRRRTAAHGDAE